MPRTITLSDEVYRAIQKDAVPFEEIPNDVIARWAKNRGLLERVRVYNYESVTNRRHKRAAPRRIEGFILFETHHSVNRWWMLIERVAEVLICKHPEKSNILASLDYILPQPDGCRLPKRIPQANLYFDAAQHTTELIRRAESILRAFGYDPTECLAIQDHIVSRNFTTSID